MSRSLHCPSDAPVHLLCPTAEYLPCCRFTRLLTLPGIAYAALWLLLSGVLLTPVAGLSTPVLFAASPERQPAAAPGSWLPADASMPPEEASTLTTTRAVQRSVADLLNREMIGRTALLFGSAGLYLLIALSFLLHWFFFRRDGPSLPIALLALTMVVHTIAISGVPSYLYPAVVPPILETRLELATFLLLNGLMGLLLWSFFPKEFRPLTLGAERFPPTAEVALPDLPGDDRGRPPLPDRLRAFNTAAALVAMATSLVFAAIALVAPLSLVAYVLPISRGITIGLMIVAVAVLLEAVERRRPMTGSIAIGFAFLLVGSLHDVLFPTGPAGDRSYLITYAFLGFVLVQSFSVARRNARYARMAFESRQHLEAEIARRIKELRAATIAAQAANLAKSQFLTAVSHELRTPLASLMGYTQILKSELNDVAEPRQREFFDTIYTSGDRLMTLINGLLDLARIEAGRLDLTITSVDVHALATDVKRHLYPLARDKGLPLETQFEQPELRALADEQRLRQVLVNLVSNAVKFTEQGHVTIRTYATTLREAPAVAIAVTDTGKGISPEFLPRLFDRFTREAGVYEAVSTGTGIGLTISEELVTRMNGEITVETDLDDGSTFTVILPRS